MNRGLLAGLASDAWKNYTPTVINAQFVGDPSPSAFSLGNGTAIGRYQQTRLGFVICQVYIEFGSTTTFGSGTCFNVRLPVRALRWSRSPGAPSGADIPIGTGQVWQGSAADPSFQKTIIPTLADPTVTVYGGEEDFYCHLFHDGSIAQGTATIAASGTSIGVTHGLNDKVQAQDVSLCPTGTASGSNWQYAYVDTFTTAGFTIRTKASVGTGGQTFAWTVRATPWTDSGSNGGVQQLVAYDRPWVFASGHSIGLELFYEAAAG